MRVFRLAVTLTLTTQLTACTKWQLQDMAPEQLLTTTNFDQVIVTRTDGKWLFLQDLRVANDTLFGTEFYSPRENLVPRSVPLSQIQYIQTKQGDGLNTSLVILLPIALIATVALSVASMCGGYGAGC